MKKKILIYIFLSLSLIIFGDQKEQIREEVNVDWWVLPVFAVDRNGDSILDLEKNEIDLKLNGSPVKNFYLYKQIFTKSGKPNTPANPIKRKNIIFLIFDSSLSTKQSLDRSKSIARRLIKNTENNHQFVVMNIRPFEGLKFVGGPSRDKSLILDLIQKYIHVKSTRRNQNLSDFIASTSGSRGRKYSQKDIRDVIRPGIERFSKHRDKTFFESFELLYYAINSIRDNKFIYLFSEGVSKTSLDSEKHIRSIYKLYMNRMAEYLGKSNAVLFIINPSGATESQSSGTSGEDSLRYLARESGGKYFEGSNKKINSVIKNIHRAYYEIAFSDPGENKSSRKITIRSKRGGVSIHTMRSLEKSKMYSEMNSIEKEILALNLLSQNQVFRIGMDVSYILPKKILKKGENTIFSLQLPKPFIRKRIDLFKIWVDMKSRDAHVEKSSLVSESGSLEVSYKKKGESEYHFIIIDPLTKSALVKGVKPEILNKAVLENDNTASPQKEVRPAPPKQVPYDQEMVKILNHISEYCEKLQNSVFHFICREKVVEVTDQLEVNYRSTPGRDYGDKYIGREGMDLKSRKRNEIINRYNYDYQIIKKNGAIKEQRLPLKGKKSKINQQNIERKIKTFFSKKAVLAPVSLLSKEMQSRYYFEKIGTEKIKGSEYIKLQATPIDSGDHLLFGTLWIDSEDYSIKKVKVNPRAVIGYKIFLAIAHKFNSKLELSTEIEFNKKRGGIRFPSKVSIVERYRGGPLLTRLRGKRGWTRTKTTFIYSKYQFFNVETTVISK